MQPCTSAPAPPRSEARPPRRYSQSEQDPGLRAKLLSFKDKVMDGRLVKFWKAAEELPGLVALSMTKTIKMYPAIGWVRTSNVANENILQEINELRKENLDRGL